MSSAKDEERLVKHALQVSSIQNQLIEQVEKTRKNAFAARNEAIRKRTETIKQVREKLVETTKNIQTSHDSVRAKLNQEAVHREANIRVNRGLEALEKFIQILRETDVDVGMLEEAIYDPIISSSIKSEAKKMVASDFFKSLQRQLIMQTEFINIAAHELRTPIMPILASVEMLEERLGDKNEEIKIIARNAKRLQRLTENILNVSRIESGTLKLNKEVFDLNTILPNVIKDENVQTEISNIKISCKTRNDNIYVNADKDRITQVVFNLLHNAIKFTKKGKVLVTSEIIDSEAVVSVRDDGTGIDSQIFPILFSKFVTKSYGGTGLGLYIAKSIVEAHGGKIWAKNNLEHGGTGATFSFSLPLAKTN